MEGVHEEYTPINIEENRTYFDTIELRLNEDPPSQCCLQNFCNDYCCACCAEGFNNAMHFIALFWLPQSCQTFFSKLH